MRGRLATRAEQRAGSEKKANIAAEELEEVLEQNGRTKNIARQPESEHNNGAQGQHTQMNYNEHGKAVKKGASLSRNHRANQTGRIHR